MSLKAGICVMRLVVETTGWYLSPEVGRVKREVDRQRRKRT